MKKIVRSSKPRLCLDKKVLFLIAWVQKGFGELA